MTTNNDRSAVPRKHHGQPIAAREEPGLHQNAPPHQRSNCRGSASAFRILRVTLPDLAKPITDLNHRRSSSYGPSGQGPLSAIRQEMGMALRANGLTSSSYPLYAQPMGRSAPKHFVHKIRYGNFQHILKASADSPGPNIAGTGSMAAIRTVLGNKELGRRAYFENGQFFDCLKSSSFIWRVPLSWERNGKKVGLPNANGTPKEQKKRNSLRMETMPSNRPPKGSVIRVEPIRSLEAIENIKRGLTQHPRDRLLFILGINTNLRACDLLALLAGTVRHLRVGQTLVVRERKTGKLRRITLNRAVVAAIQAWLAVRPDLTDASPLFPSRKGGNPLGVSTLNRMVKRWCREAGLKENHGCHTLRKTFGYVHRVKFGTDVPTLMVLFNHSSQRQTLEYLGIQDVEMARAYLREI